MFHFRITVKSILVIIGALLLIGCVSDGTDRIQGVGMMPLVGDRQPVNTALRQATVQITHYKKDEIVVTTADKNTEEAVQTRYAEVDVAYGLGTLVTLDDEVVLITHDHWPNYAGVERPDRVRFHDGEGHLLLEVGGDHFSQNILFRDSGTLIMRPPAGLLERGLVPASLSHIGRLEAADIVTVVRRRPGRPAQIDLIQAQVEEINYSANAPQIGLRSLNGETIEPGDSGGGIWLDGGYVGNMWLTVRHSIANNGETGETLLVGTEQSIAAGMTAELINLIRQLQPSKAMPPGGDSPLS